MYLDKLTESLEFRPRNIGISGAIVGGNFFLINKFGAKVESALGSMQSCILIPLWSIAH